MNERADVAELLIALLTLTLLIPYYLEAITRFAMSKDVFRAFQNLLVADILLITMSLFYEPFYHYLRDSDTHLTSAIFAVLLLLSSLVLVEWITAFTVPDNFVHKLTNESVERFCISLLPFCSLNAATLTGVAYIMSCAHDSMRSKIFYILSFIASLVLLILISIIGYLIIKA